MITLNVKALIQIMRMIIEMIIAEEEKLVEMIMDVMLNVRITMVQVLDL